MPVVAQAAQAASSICVKLVYRPVKLVYQPVNGLLIVIKHEILYKHYLLSLRQSITSNNRGENRGNRGTLTNTVNARPARLWTTQCYLPVAAEIVAYLV